jgi:hypothetical protein
MLELTFPSRKQKTESMLLRPLSVLQVHIHTYIHTYILSHAYKQKAWPMTEAPQDVVKPKVSHVAGDLLVEGGGGCAGGSESSVPPVPLLDSDSDEVRHLRVFIFRRLQDLCMPCHLHNRVPRCLIVIGMRGVVLTMSDLDELMRKKVLYVCVCVCVCALLECARFNMGGRLHTCTLAWTGCSTPSQASHCEYDIVAGRKIL